MVADQKAAFAQRLKRIQSGKQFEHADIIGQKTTKRYKKRFGDKPRKKRSLADKVMVLIAFLAGLASVLLGRIVYFHLARIEGLPPAFYDLGGRGMALAGLVLAMTMIVVFHLSTRTRMPALLLGCAVMYYGEAAVASNAPEFWTQIFSAEYAAEMAARGQDYRLTPTG